MHPSFRLFPALLVKISARETRPGSSQKRELLRDSNSRSLDLILPALLGAADRGPKSYERHRLWIKEPNLSF